MLTLEWEPLRRLLDEGVEELLARHWEEVAVDHDSIPLAPDWDRAFALQAAGVLRTAALRRNGRLIGYNAFHVLQPLHYRMTTHAVNDVLYVDPDERGTAGLRGGALDLALSLHAPQFAALSPLAGTGLPALRDVAAEARLSSPSPGVLALRGLRVTSAAGDLSGDLALGRAPRPSLRGTLASQRLDGDALALALQRTPRLSVTSLPVRAVPGPARPTTTSLGP